MSLICVHKNMIRVNFLVFFGSFIVASYAAPDCSQPPPNKNFIDCCKRPQPMIDVENKCGQKFPHTEDTIFCKGQCIFTDVGVFNDGKIHSEKAPAAIDTLFKGYSEFIPVANSAFTKCQEQSKVFVPKMLEKYPKAAEKCHPLPAFLANCFLAEAFMNCPSSMWDTDKKCDGAQDYMQKCILEAIEWK